MKTKIIESLRNMEKLIYFIDDDNVVLGFKQVETNNEEKFPFHALEDTAIMYFSRIDSIAAKALKGLSEDDEFSLKKDFIRLKKLLADCNVQEEDMLKMIEGYNEKQLEQLNLQIKVYKIINDLSQGKNLLKEPESLKDYIFYLLELNNPSGNYPGFSDTE